MCARFLARHRQGAIGTGVYHPLPHYASLTNDRRHGRAKTHTRGTRWKMLIVIFLFHTLTTRDQKNCDAVSRFPSGNALLGFDSASPLWYDPEMGSPYARRNDRV